jgi:7-cyano-7-deazaguanine synthase
VSRRLRALVLLSGGIDSAACAHFLKSDADVQGLFLDFNQSAANQERKAAKILATQLDIPFEEFSIRPAGQRGAGELVGRNAFLLSTALFLSAGRHNVIAIGIHAGTPYYDCSPAFERLMAQVIAEQTDSRVTLLAPFVDWTKGDVFSYFETTGLRAADTYSCEAGTNPVCGRCASCRDREALGC